MLLVIQVTWSDRQSSQASKGGHLPERELHPAVQGCVALPYHLMQISLTQMQVELFQVPNTVFMFSLCLASTQERTVSHSYFDLGVQYRSSSVSGLSDKVS